MNYLDDLRLRIKSKYRTISKFCIVAGLDAYEVQKLFQNYSNCPTPERKNQLQEIDRKLKLISSVPAKEVSDDERSFVQQCIKKNFKNTFSFVKACQVSKASVYHLLSGEMVNKNKDFSKIMKFCREIDQDLHNEYRQEKEIFTAKARIRNWIITGFEKSKKPTTDIEDLKKFIVESEEMNTDFVKSRISVLESLGL